MLNIWEDSVAFLWKMVPLNLVCILYIGCESHVVRGSKLDHLLIVWLRLKPVVMLPTTYTLAWLLLTRVGKYCELYH